MLEHIEDRADLNMLIDDSGGFFVVCSGCKKQWVGKLSPVESPTSVKKATRMLDIALRVNPSILKDAGIDN